MSAGKDIPEIDVKHAMWASLENHCNLVVPASLASAATITISTRTEHAIQEPEIVHCVRAIPMVVGVSIVKNGTTVML